MIHKRKFEDKPTKELLRIVHYNLSYTLQCDLCDAAFVGKMH